MINIAILGYGTIGSGVAEIIDRNNDILKKRIGDDIAVKKILDLRDFPGDVNESKITHDYDEILNDDEINIVVECMGGVEPAYTFVKKALLKNKSVTTSNKALVAVHGSELINIARDLNINFTFEASVGGGIPIIRSILKCLTSENILEITGILNGTTNFMMTKMSEEGSDYDDVLKEAQSLGYAEADPTADVEGHDSCRKIAILTSLVCGKQVDFEKIHTEGISKITATDIKYAKVMGRSIKLLATSRKEGDSYYALVAPMLLTSDHPLYNVNGVFNAVFVKGDMLGDSMFYGSGAGKLPTASAVVADIVDMSKHLHVNIYVDWENEELALADYRKSRKRFFVRTSDDESKVKDTFGDVEFIRVEGISGEIGFITDKMSEEEYEKAASDINVIQMIRA